MFGDGCMITPHESEISQRIASDIANRNIQVQAMWGELPSQQSSGRGNKSITEIDWVGIFESTVNAFRMVFGKRAKQIDQLNPDGEEITWNEK
jgi:hypothetical protein